MLALLLALLALNFHAGDTPIVSLVDYLKIDVDGFEPDVFARAGNLFAAGKIKMLQSEFCDYWLRRNGSSPELLHDTLTRSGFKDV